MKEPSEWPRTLSEPIEREPPWISLVPPSPEDNANNLDQALKVEIERAAKLPALAAHFGIKTEGVDKATWLMVLASRLATDAGIPGFQEKWIGPTAEVLKDNASLRTEFALQLGLKTSPSGKVVGAPPANLPETTAALMARLLAAGRPDIKLDEIARKIHRAVHSGGSPKRINRKLINNIKNKIYRGNRRLRFE